MDVFTSYSLIINNIFVNFLITREVTGDLDNYFIKVNTKLYYII